MFYMHRYIHPDFFVRPHFHQNKALKHLKEILLKFHIYNHHSLYLFNFFIKKRLVTTVKSKIELCIYIHLLSYIA